MYSANPFYKKPSQVNCRKGNRMGKKRRPKSKKRLMLDASMKRRSEAQIRTVATDLLTTRAKLKKLLIKRRTEGSLTDAEAIEVQQLLAMIEKTKAAITQLGYTPVDAISKLIEERKAAEKARSSAVARKKVPYTSGGIGMYGLGANLKLWR